MIIDEYGLPVDDGAATKADSARLAGMMALVNHPLAPPLEEYFVDDMNPVRHPYATVYPENNPRVMSRDQLVCLAAGLSAQGNIKYAQRILDLCTWFAPNNMDEQTRRWKIPDPISPQVRNHFKMCAIAKGTDFGYQCLILDIILNGKYNPLGEQNQTQAMVLTAEKRTAGKWCKFYVRNTPKWKEATRKYWIDDRIGYCKGEPELCEMIIKTIEGYL